MLTEGLALHEVLFDYTAFIWQGIKPVNIPLTFLFVTLLLISLNVVLPFLEVHTNRGSHGPFNQVLVDRQMFEVLSDAGVAGPEMAERECAGTCLGHIALNSPYQDSYMSAMRSEALNWSLRALFRKFMELSCSESLATVLWIPNRYSSWEFV